MTERIYNTASCQTSPAKGIDFNVQFSNVANANANTYENDRIPKRDIEKKEGILRN
jgi:hypothetical protein